MDIRVNTREFEVRFGALPTEDEHCRLEGMLFALDAHLRYENFGQMYFVTLRADGTEVDQGAALLEAFAKILLHVG